MTAMKNPRWRAYLGLVLIAAGLVALPFMGSLVEHAPRFVLFYGLSCAGFALVATATASLPLRGVIVAAVILRVIFLPVTPSLTNDYYRYIWDGRVQLQGINPYLYTPRSPALDSVAYDDRGLINHDGLRTIYPPLAQAAFLGVAAFDGGLPALKLVFGAFDLAAAIAIWWLAAPRRRHAATVLYLLCPAVILQTWWSAHLEAIAVFFVVAAAALLVHRRDAAAGVALGFAVAFRVTPLVLLVPVLLGGRTRPLRFLAGFLPAIAIPYAPYLLTGGAFGSLFQGGTTWTGSAFIFSPLARVVSPRVALLLCAIILATGSLAIARSLRGRESTAAAFAWELSLLLICLPVVHSWYWLPPLALGLAGGVWLPVAMGIVTPLGAVLPRAWEQHLPPWPQAGILTTSRRAIVHPFAHRRGVPRRR